MLTLPTRSESVSVVGLHVDLIPFKVEEILLFIYDSVVLESMYGFGSAFNVGH